MLTVALSAVVVLIVVLPIFARYLDEQQELRDAKSRLSTVQEHNAELECELKPWKDSDHVKTQARERLGYVIPEQTLYVVIDPSRGTATERLQKKADPVNKKHRAATPWYMTMWDSVKIVGQNGKTDNVGDVPVVEGRGSTNK